MAEKLVLVGVLPSRSSSTPTAARSNQTSSKLLQGVNCKAVRRVPGSTLALTNIACG
jgi:hypothetical protein